ncbi:hypothetical protein D9M71_722230 [compost metagenome]
MFAVGQVDQRIGPALSATAWDMQLKVRPGGETRQWLDVAGHQQHAADSGGQRLDLLDPEREAGHTQFLSEFAVTL